jgi:hypothetical protein
MSNPICEVDGENTGDTSMLQTEGGFVQFDGLSEAGKYVGANFVCTEQAS